jgi:ketosteroid isomerase-like protein
MLKLTINGVTLSLKYLHKAKGRQTYNNSYAMVFKMLDGQILDFQEYHSDLLAETRLHKKAVVDL